MTTNPALSPLQFLAGAWDMELSGAAFLPDPDASGHGPVTFDWRWRPESGVNQRARFPIP
jgi:hypothetical protein